MYDILVVGSGISALSFIDGLRTHKKKVAIIAYNKLHKNKNENIVSELNKININKKNLPPRFGLNSKVYSLIQYFKKNKINVKKKISFFGYLNSGGVSNFWGCSCQFPSAKKINFLNSKNKNKLINSFSHFYNKYNFTGKYNDELKNKNFKNRKIDSYFLKIINKMDILKNNINFYINCIAEDKNSKLTFVPKNIDKTKVKKIKSFNYFVEKIERKNSYYEVFCRDNENKEFIILTKKLILAAGTIASTKLVSQMIGFKKKISIQHNPMIFGFFLAKKNLDISKKFEPSHLAANIRVSSSNSSAIANFRPSNKTIKDKIFNNFIFMRNFFSKKLFSIFEKRIIFINLYIDNKFSNLQMEVLKNGKTNIFIKKKNYTFIKNELNKNFSFLYKDLMKKKFIYPFKYSYLPDLGTDNHFTGTIPISKKESKLTVNENCELNNYKNLYIVDGASIPKSDLKFPTGMIMANAYRIGKLL